LSSHSPRHITENGTKVVVHLSKRALPFLITRFFMLVAFNVDYSLLLQTTALLHVLRQKIYLYLLLLLLKLGTPNFVTELPRILSRHACLVARSCQKKGISNISMTRLV